MKIRTACTAAFGTTLITAALAVREDLKYDYQAPLDGSGVSDAERYAGACPDYTHYAAKPQ
jgi:hypothetical protein